MSSYVWPPEGGGSGGSGITSINGDTTAAQLINGGTGIHVVTAGGITTISSTATSYHAIGNSGSSFTVDWSATPTQDGVQSVTLTASTVTASFTNANVGQILTLVVTQDSTGSRVVKMPTGVEYTYGASQPYQSTIPGAADVYVFTCIASNVYLAQFYGHFYATNPSTIAGGPSLWIDATDSTIITASAGFNLVSALKNKGSISVTGTQSTPSAMPVLKRGGLNGYSALQFAGAQALDFGSTAAFTAAGGGTIFAVAEVDASPTTFPRLVLLATDQSEPWTWGFATDSSYNDIWFGSNSVYALGRFPVSSTYVGSPIIGSVNYNGSGAGTLANYTAQVFGSSASVTAAGALGSSTNESILGANDNTGTEGFVGLIYEIIVYSSSLSSGDMLSVNNYLFNKYGI